VRRRTALAAIAAGVAAALLTSACPIESPYLDEIEDQIYRDLGPPADPSGLTATALDPDRIDLSWSDNSDVEQAFEVERKRSAIGEFERIATLSPGATAYRDTGLDSQTTYFYQVRAVNAGGPTVWLQADATTHQLAAPTGLVVAALDETRIDVSWTDASEYEEGFELQLAAGPEAPWVLAYPSLAPGTESVAETTLASGTGYAYRVRAIDGGGASEWSNEAAAITAYEIGDMGPAGGVVFFDDADDGDDDYEEWRYMEVAPASAGQWVGADWGESKWYLGIPIPFIGSGWDLTHALDPDMNASRAASRCFDLATPAPHEYGVSVAAEGWHLPSADELYELYLFYKAYDPDIGIIASPGYYYSSTEESSTLVHAVNMENDAGGARTYATKDPPVVNPYVTRAVRYFDWQPPGTPP
jgi:hypothetical protein